MDSETLAVVIYLSIIFGSILSGVIILLIYIKQSHNRNNGMHNCKRDYNPDRCIFENEGKLKYSKSYKYNFLKSCDKDFLLVHISKEIEKGIWDEQDIIEIRNSLKNQLEKEKKEMNPRKKVLYQTVDRDGVKRLSEGYIDATITGDDGKLYHEIELSGGEDFRGYNRVWICGEDVRAVLGDPRNCNCNCHKDK